MSAEPDKPQTPVSRGERIAAGVLVVWWLCVAVVSQMWPWHWWRMVLDGLGHVRDGWQAFLAGPTADGSAPFGPAPILNGIVYILALGVWLGPPVLVGWAVVITRSCYQRQRRSALWSVALGHGLLAFVALSVQGRYLVVQFASFQAPTAPAPAWYEGWLILLVGEHASLSYIATFLAEIVLAAAVLWFSRRRKGEAQVQSAPT